jgi:IS605 OrfB family transposase
MYQKAGKRSHSIYRMLTGANRQLSIDTCREIMRISELYDTDCIVFEHLERTGKARGRKFRERIHMWRAADVQKRVTLQAHRRGMRISRVCAWGTSKYAFDGSGEVARGKDADLDTYSLCRFPTGKVYNCDLSAAQNIGARFFLREYAKLPGCPGLPKTPRRTYDTLVSLVRSMAA